MKIHQDCLFLCIKVTSQTQAIASNYLLLLANGNDIYALAYVKANVYGSLVFP